MNKNEFMDYLKFVKDLFPRANVPVNKEIIGVWYKPFVNTHLQVAKEMAQMYFQDEENSFNFARLLQYKSKAMAGKTYFEESVKVNRSCPYCDGLGFVEIEERVKNRFYQHIYKCVCKGGERYPAYPKLNLEMLKDKEKYVSGVYK